MNIPITNDQIALARSKLWTPDLDRLLRRWKDQISKRQIGHTHQARKFSRRHYILGIPTTLIGAIVCTGILATFRKCSSCADLNSTRCEIDQWIRLIAGIIGLVSAALAALMTFMNYQDIAGDHKDASTGFENLHRVIETLLQVPGSVRGDPVATLHNLRDQYTTLVRNSPQLPKKYDVNLSYRFDTHGPKPPEPDQVSIPDTKNNILPLRKLLEDEVSKVKVKFNSQDSEEEEVQIGFDLDSTRSVPQNQIALKAAILATERESQVQKSLSKALEFELQRLDTHAGHSNSDLEEVSLESDFEEDDIEAQVSNNESS